MTASELLSVKTNYINPNIAYVFNRDITEYDIKSAGLSIIREGKLVSDSTIESLLNCSKKERVVLIGKLQRKDDKLKKSLEAGFTEMRKRFIDKNELEVNDILSIKKDAIFTLKPCHKLNMGEYVEFVPKNKYTSYIHLSNRIELYYSSINGLDIKGLGDSNIEKHKDYMISFLERFFNCAESNSAESVRKFLRHFVTDYKLGKLDIGYYRTFDVHSVYQIDLPEISQSDEWDDVETVKKDYNLYNVFIKLTKIYS